ncbi:MAG: VOC family protein [Erysipelotrichia bacterium]|jgi:predicted lactoylglutathione lyase|nr:VOC family protein [Erysipelotrichia bacterium]
MKLGAFSISLAVKDILVSKAFYEALGFESIGGDVAEKWCILRNDQHVIGLFEGMFEKNILTFNPGWNQSTEEVNPFTDVREIQKMLIEKGITPIQTVDPNTTGPGYFTLQDPDGNDILFDQHR